MGAGPAVDGQSLGTGIHQPGTEFQRRCGVVFVKYPHFGSQGEFAVGGDRPEAAQGVADILTESGTGTFFHHFGNGASEIEIEQGKLP